MPDDQKKLSRRRFLKCLGLMITGVLIFPVLKSLEKLKKSKDSSLKEARYYTQNDDLLG